MNVSAAQIDDIVREVLRRLASSSASSSAAGAASETRSLGETRSNRRQLTWNQRVVTAAALRDVLDGVAELSVPPRTVVTPEARDLLRRYGVALRWAEAAGTPRTAAAATARPLVLGAADTTYDSSPLVAALARSRIRVQQVAHSGLAGVVAELADAAAKDGLPAVLITGQPAAAVCLANRRRGVRAAGGATRREAGEAVRAIGANLLIVDPRGRSFFDLLRGMEDFCRGHPWICPQPLRGVLA